MAKDKQSDFRLYGFGHRVYKDYDPRAKILRDVCDRVFARIRSAIHCSTSRGNSSWRPADSYFVDRKLYPNVDFYSGILLRASGIPTNMFTVCFAIGRLPGWIAHWKRRPRRPASRIIRPRQVYVSQPRPTTLR